MELKMEFESREALLEGLEQMRRLAGTMCSHSEEVPTRGQGRVVFLMAGKNIGEVEVEVVYSAPQGEVFQVGVEFLGEWGEALDEVEKNSISSSAKSAKEGQWGKDSENIQERIKQLTTHEKIRLAMRAGRQERLILLKDSHYMVHPYVLKNPRVTVDEVQRIARMPSINGEMIQTISNNTEWMGNNGVRLAIVKNPKTPLPIIEKHINRLRDGDLMIIAKSQNVKDAVSRSAKKILARKGKVVK